MNDVRCTVLRSAQRKTVWLLRMGTVVTAGYPRGIKRRSLTSLQQRLVKTGGRLVKHARYYWLLLAEGHRTRRLFSDLLRRILIPALGTDE